MGPIGTDWDQFSPWTALLKGAPINKAVQGLIISPNWTRPQVQGNPDPTITVGESSLLPLVDHSEKGKGLHLSQRVCVKISVVHSLCSKPEECLSSRERTVCL